MTLERYLLELKIYWIKYPLLRLLIPFSIGIILRDSIQVSTILLSIVLVLLIGTLILIHRKIKTNLGLVPWFGAVASLFYAGFGLLWSTIRNESNQPGHFKVESKVALITRAYYIEEKDRYWDCYSDVLFQKLNNSWNKANGTLLLRVPKASSYLPNARDVIYGEYRLLKPDHNAAPFEFDWANHLDHRNIHHITYLDTTHFQILNKAKTSFLEKCRSWSDNIILTIFGNNRDYPVATAMLLGLRKKIDPELYRAYSATGAVHVLAVSGLHVGILAKIIELLFGFLMRRSKAKKIILPGIVILCIWLYTILTGGTPSILRSALMFTLFIIGRLLQKDAQPLNILAASAWVLLVINPDDIYNIGFQLSFGAMAGIFILYEPIRVLWPIGNKVLQILWEITAVSLAAQLFIYPIVGYHFHQFAFYFWLTSIVSTPFSYIIIAAGVAIFPLKALGLTFLYWIDYLLIYSVKWMNDIIEWVYTMPLGKLNGWWPSTIDVMILIFISILFGLFLKKRNYYSVSILLYSLILLFMILTSEKFLEANRSEIIASQFRGRSKIWIKNRNTLIQINGDSTIINSNYADKYDFRNPDIILLDSVKNYCKGENIEVDLTSIRAHSNLYKIIKSRSNEIKTDEVKNAHLIVMNKYWKPDTMSLVYPSKVYCFDKSQSEILKTFYPITEVVCVESSFIQLQLK